MERVILTETNFSRLKEFVKKNKGKEIVFSSNDDDLNRKVLEKLEVNFILIKLENRKDYLKQRNSGLNEVMVKIAKKKNVGIGIDFDELKESKDKEKILSRIRQNISLCKRVKVRMKFFSENEQDAYFLKSLGLVLGMPTWMVKEVYY